MEAKIVRPLLLCGGKGKRLLPLTERRLKPLLPVAGVSLLERLLLRLREDGFSEAWICGGAGENATILRDAVKNMSVKGISVTVIEEAENAASAGTAGCVKEAREQLIGEGHISRSDPILILCGDAWLEGSLTPFLRDHAAHPAAGATLLLSESDTPTDMGQVQMSKTGKITAFREKPAWCQVSGAPVSTGIYLVEGRLFDLLPVGRFDFGMDVWSRMLKSGETLRGHLFEGSWQDVGTPDGYLRCCLAARKGKSDISPGAVLNRGCRITKSVIGDGCVIGEKATVERSVLGEGCMIGKGAVLDGDCVLGDGCVIGEGAWLQAGCTLPGNTVIGQGATVPGENLLPNGLFGDNCLRLTPEMGGERWLLRLGQALSLASETLSIPADGRAIPAILSDSGCEEIKQMLAKGMASAGEVADLGSGSIGMARYLSHRCGFSLTACVSYVGQGEFRLDLFDHHGMYPGTRFERRLGDLLREGAREKTLPSGEKKLLRGGERSYLAALEKLCPPLCGRAYRITAEEGLETDRSLLETVLRRMGGSRGIDNRALHLRLVKTENGTGLRIEDAQRECSVTHWQVIGIIAGFLTRDEREGGRIALPENTPEALKRMLRQSGSRLLCFSHTCSDRSEAVAHAVAATEPWLWDGCFAAVMLLRIMAKTGAGLRELAMLLPTFRYWEQKTDFPEDRKCELLRFCGEKGIPTSDGILLAERDGGYIRISARRGAAVRYSVEAADEADAASLLRRAKKAIRKGKR